MNELPLPTAADVLSAATRLAPHAALTPVLRSRELDALTGARLAFKAEHLQRGGAFKFRGACNAVMALAPEQAAQGVVTHSSGNHGAALALAARLRGIACHVVVPEGAVAAKLANIARHGATLWRCAPTIAAREQLFHALQAMPGVRRVYRSAGNYLLVRFDDAQGAFDALLAAGIVVRDQRAAPQLGDALRISIGTTDDNQRVLDALSGRRAAA